MAKRFAPLRGALRWKSVVLALKASKLELAAFGPAPGAFEWKQAWVWLALGLKRRVLEWR